MTLFVTANLTKELSVRKNVCKYLKMALGYLTYYVRIITRYVINMIRFIN